jgi:plasmid maintenance system antidote protein VapI
MSVEQKPNEFSKFREGLNVAPITAGEHFKNFMEKKKLTASEVAKNINSSVSTVTRLCSGGALSVPMAVKIERSYNLSAKMMFNLEANYKAYKAEQALAVA